MKRLLLAGALSLAGAVALTAQTVTSINAVGYANVVIPAGFSMVANPLASQAMNLAALFPSDTPSFSVVYKFNGTTFDQSLYLGNGNWTTVGGTNMTLSPGEGCFFKNNGAAFTNTFVGEVLTGNLVNAIPTGFSMRASQVPQQGGVQTLLGLPAGHLDTVYTFNNAGGTYNQSLYLNGTGWIGGEPNISVGQAFWILRATANGSVNWTRTFTIN